MRSIVRSPLALAMALATGSAIGMVGFAAPAVAQDDAKKDYSKPFIAAYQPVAEQSQAGGDPAALKASVPGVVSAASTPDDRYAAGQLAFSIGRSANDEALQRQGLKMMVDSGRTPAAQIGQYNFVLGQMAYQAKNWAEARQYLQQAVSAGYSEGDPQALLAETYFGSGQYNEGLDMLGALIDDRLAAGQTVPENWFKRGLGVAYENDLPVQTNRYMTYYVENYPNDTSWGDAVAIALTTNQFDGPATLDLLRLGQRVNALREGSLYKEYVETADARRLPGEVKRVIEDGIAKGKLDRSDPYIAETLATATSRAAADQKDLSTIESDARGSGANLRSVVAAGDVFLNYGDGAKAEEFYTKALGMSGADTATLLTRKGIAQVEQGKYAEAQATFAQVEGARQAISRLWGVYAGQQGG